VDCALSLSWSRERECWISWRQAFVSSLGQRTVCDCCQLRSPQNTSNRIVSKSTSVDNAIHIPWTQDHHIIEQQRNFPLR
jgi:hypothetical protein